MSPFSPFNFAPGEMVDKILEKASQAQQSGGQGGGAGQQGAKNGAGLGNQMAGHGSSSPGAAASGGGGGGGQSMVASNSSESSQTTKLASVNVQTDSANNQSTNILPTMTQVAKADLVQPEGINPPPVQGQNRGMQTAAAPLMPPPPTEKVA